LLFENDYENYLIYLTAGKDNPRFVEAIQAINYLKQFELKINLIEYPHPGLDGSLYLDCNQDGLRQLSKFVQEFHPDEIVSSYYEGGNQDHDTAFILSLLVAKSLGIPFIAFSTYRKSRNILIRFTVMKTLKNARALNFKNLLAVRVSFRLMSIYKSQHRTWLGLGPFVLVRYLHGTSKSQEYVDNFT
jgi:hypothetical protein